MGYVRIIFLKLSRTLLVIDLRIILEMLKICKPLPQEHNSIMIHFSH